MREPRSACRTPTFDAVAGFRNLVVHVPGSRDTIVTLWNFAGMDIDTRADRDEDPRPTRPVVLVPGHAPGCASPD